MLQMRSLVLIFLIAHFASAYADYYVEIMSNAPVVSGATVEFNAQVYKDGHIPNKSFRFSWSDFAYPKHEATFEVDSSASKWNITYDKKYPVGTYTVQVVVEVWYGVYYFQVTSNRLSFEVTPMLNGDMKFIQPHNLSPNNLIATGNPVTMDIDLKQSDLTYLNKSATSIVTYWFIDCIYAGNSTNFKLQKNFTKGNSEHMIEALVVAGFEPIPPPPTPAPNVTTTTIKPTTTTPKPKPKVAKRSISHLSNQTIKPNDSESIKLPFVCSNSSDVKPILTKTYGYFTKNVTVKVPIVNITITGSNWIQKSELVNFVVKCAGSGPINYCIHYYNGVYNVTGNETCTIPLTTDECELYIQHYFIRGEQHTIVVVLMNEVSKEISPIAVTIYQVAPVPQISVIIVPVVFSLVAVVLIVFGIAYFIQNGSRFTVEVADFDFGQQYAETEYKTFYQRLRESIMSAFTPLRNEDSTPDVETQPTSNGFKYGNMT